jgi:hypothetical protein
MNILIICLDQLNSNKLKKKTKEKDIGKRINPASIISFQLDASISFARFSENLKLAG